MKKIVGVASPKLLFLCEQYPTLCSNFSLHPFTDEYQFVLGSQTQPHALELYHTPSKLSLQLDFDKDFSTIYSKYNFQNSALLKTFKGNATIVDGTTGLCKDSFILLCHQFKLTLVEQNPIVYYLVQNALERIQHPTLRSLVEQHLQSFHLDSIQHWLPQQQDHFSAIYLDFMFNVF